MSEAIISEIKEITEQFNAVFWWEQNLKTFAVNNDGEINPLDVWVSLHKEFSAACYGSDRDLLFQFSQNIGTRFENVLTAGAEGQILRLVKGDCNNIAQSIIDEVIKRGLLPLDKITFQLVRSSFAQTQNPMPYIDHAIAQFDIDGRLFNADNAAMFKFHRASQDPHYRYLEYMRMDIRGQMFKHDAETSIGGGVNAERYLWGDADPSPPPPPPPPDDPNENQQ